MLLLFDIDGTLLAGATEAHRLALHAALRAAHGIDPDSIGRPPAPAGRTDGEIARLILLRAGVSAERIDERADQVRRLCCDEYTRLCPDDLTGTVLPAVRETLEWAHARDGAISALLTGNYEPIARLKLARAGLGSCFARHQGAFGSDSEDRAMLPEIARRRAGTRGHPYPRERTVVIGDTPRDIACARADGVHVVAVATGPFSTEELTGADAVVPDASKLPAALAGLGA
jgi:phosphoglycolate phosphatase